MYQQFCRKFDGLTSYSILARQSPDCENKIIRFDIETLLDDFKNARYLRRLNSRAQPSSFPAAMLLMLLWRMIDVIAKVKLLVFAYT